MGPIQSIILGEADRAKPAIVFPVAKEEVKPTVQPSSNIVSSSAVIAPDDPGPDEYARQSNGQKQGGETQSTQQSQIDQQPSKPFNSMGDVVDAAERKSMPTEEELKKERKREKSRQIISAIADGVSAISNLYFTGKGAKNVEQTSMSEANSKRYREILDRRRKIQEKWDDARLAAYDRDRAFNYQHDRDDANWNRAGEWHDDQIKKEDERYKDNKSRAERIEAENKERWEKEYGIRVKEQESHEKARKDASAREWASVGVQKERVKVQEDKQKAYVKYQFEKANGAPEPKRINSTRSIYVGKHTWEQNAGQIAGEIVKDIEASDPALAKQLRKQLIGYGGKKGADAKQTAAIVDKYIMSSPRAQQLAIELEKDYKKRYELATGGSLLQNGTDDLGFVPSSPEEGSADVDSLFD